MHYKIKKKICGYIIKIKYLLILIKNENKRNLKIRITKNVVQF